MEERISQSIKAMLEVEIFNEFADSITFFSCYFIEKPEINIYLKSKTPLKSIKKLQ
jgi:hypothetical protein